MCPTFFSLRRETSLTFVRAPTFGTVETTSRPENDFLFLKLREIPERKRNVWPSHSLCDPELWISLKARQTNRACKRTRDRTRKSFFLFLFFPLSLSQQKQSWETKDFRVNVRMLMVTIGGISEGLHAQRFLDPFLEHFPHSSENG